MADKKISELTELTTPDGTEELVVNDSGVSKKVQIDNLIADNGLSGNKIDGGTISNFTSTGIDDNATSTAITIDASENVLIGGALTTTKGASVSVGVTQAIADTADAVDVLTISAPESGSANLVAGNGPAIKFKIPGNVNASYDGARIAAQKASNTDGNYRTNLTFKTNVNSDATETLTEQMRIDYAGDVTVNSGNLVIGTSGKGIDFSAVSDGSRSVSSNILDDYETGTFTCTLTPSTSGSITLNTGKDTLSYTKIGRVVHISGRINIASVSSPVGNANLNLPFTAANLSEHSDYYSLKLTCHSLAMDATGIGLFGELSGGNATYTITEERRNSDWVTYAAASIVGDGNDWIMFDGTYIAA